MLIGIALTSSTSGRSTSARCSKRRSDSTGGDLVGDGQAGIALLLFAGAVGKSAQFPLHTCGCPTRWRVPPPCPPRSTRRRWSRRGLPRGPHPRPVRDERRGAGPSSWWSAWSPRCSRDHAPLAQYDFKRVLAYSTVSQLGYMFFAAGMGAYSAAMFLLVVHAFFKAAMFLAAGSVMHGVHDETDVKRMGGLRGRDARHGFALPGWRPSRSRGPAGSSRRSSRRTRCPRSSTTRAG